MDIQVFTADAAGNKTAFVLTPFDREMYPHVGNALLSNSQLNVEQVAFVCPRPRDADGRIEMCGLEFCGNATRSYALYLGKNYCEPREDDRYTLRLRVSGYDGILTVKVDTEYRTASLTLPHPATVKKYTAGRFNIALDTYVYIVTMKGITHAVLFDVPAYDEVFQVIKDVLVKETQAEAIGVMFCSRSENFVTPIVYVRDVDSTFHEGSCGSGTIAVASVLATEKSSDPSINTYTFHQPGGTLSSTVATADGRVISATIDGIIDIGSVETVTI